MTSAYAVADNTVMARLRASVPLLGPSERRVAQLVISRPDEIVEWSTSELATEAKTSPATVIRACQSLGFRGFQHLRLEVARAAPTTQNEGTDPLSRAFSEALDALTLGRNSIDAATVADAAVSLASARRILLVGSGFSAPALQDTAMRFTTLGRSVEAPTDVIAQQFASHSLTAADVCLAVSYSGANAHTLAACRAARDCGATLIVLTSFARSPIARLASIALVTAPVSRAHDVDPFLSRLNHLVVLHALYNALAAHSATANVAEMRRVVADALSDDS